MSVTLRTTPSRLSIALTNCESLSVRIGSAARPGGVNIPRCSFTNETSGVGAEARRSPTIDGLDAIIELFSKLGFDVGFNLLGDFPESRNMGPLIRSPIARGGRRARCREPVLSSATSRTSSTCSASNAPGAVARAGINAGRKKARLCRVSCRTSAEMASHQLFPAASLGQSQHSRAYLR